MITLLFVLALTYLIGTFFGYVIHWSLHQSWTGPLNKSHMTHHLKMYPPLDFTSDVYRSAGKDNTTKTFLLAFIPLTLLPIACLYFGIISLSTLITIIIFSSLLGYLHNYLHDSFHIRNHWLLKVPFLNILFKKWVRLHYLHHINMKKNYGIFIFHWDRIFKTFWS